MYEYHAFIYDPTDLYIILDWCNSNDSTFQICGASSGASEARAVASMLLVHSTYNKDFVGLRIFNEVNFIQFLASGLGEKNIIQVQRGHVGQVQALNTISAPSSWMLKEGT